MSQLLQMLTGDVNFHDAEASYDSDGSNTIVVISLEEVNQGGHRED